MDESKTELHLRGFLERIGFKVERIAVNEEDPRADYLITDDSDSYVMEVKSRDNDREYLVRLDKDGFAEKEAFLGRTNSISARIQDAQKQLAATPTGPNAYRIIVIVVSEEDTESDIRQTDSTLYGKVDLLVDEKDGVAIAKPCYYFTFNEFFRMPNVEAAILFAPEGSMLLLNLFSPTLETFRQTLLSRQYEEKHAIIDPAKEESAGEALIADCSIDRRDEKAVIDYVQKKYGLDHVIPFKPRMYTAASRVPVRARK